MKSRTLYHQVYHLPAQLERSIRRTQMLARRAAEYRMQDILHRHRDRIEEIRELAE